jgi:dTDP-4-dehydrorhamnose reductase
MKKVLVTGANGQLAKCIEKAAPGHPQLNLRFATREQLDIEDPSEIQSYFDLNEVDVCINTAAYTHVDKAESEKEKAFAVNAKGVRNLARICAAKDVLLIHISTDYVFDGTKRSPYLESDKTNPVNVYGASKLAGEEAIRELCERYYIVRTSWLYSEFGHNFFKTILKHADAGNPLTITTEQLGSPTNANDLAAAILTVTETDKADYGVYHFSNEGEATWFDFAEAILKESGQIKTANLAKTDHYRTFARRPVYSILNCTKFYESFKVTPVNWKDSLRTLFVENNNQK